MVALCLVPRWRLDEVKTEKSAHPHGAKSYSRSIYGLIADRGASVVTDFRKMAIRGSATLAQIWR
jgi:hypothetical protein